MNKAYQLYHTVKYLKLIQIFSRIRRRFLKIDLKIPGEINRRTCTKTWKKYELLESHHVSVETFIFLNHEGNIGNWNDAHQSKLWLYNLHYFDYINSIDNEKQKKIYSSLITRWIKENKPLQGNGWEPYPLSLRIVNWTKYFLVNGEHSALAEISLYQQAHVLSQNLEYHLLGNHLFANAKALVFAGCYFCGDLSDYWMTKGLEILDTEVSEQILSDGGNFELSPMYHNIILADMLDLYNLAQCYQCPALIKRVNKWKEVIDKMFEYSRALSHSDGDVSFFNDSAMGIAPKYSDLIKYAKQLNVALKPTISSNDATGCPTSQLSYRFFKNSGYIVIEAQNQKTILDTAKIGPDYIPGHAHADTLSFEMSIFDERVFVNSGIGEYGLSDERLRQRKTAAHNTVEVDGQDSSEVWSGFRVARRAYPSNPIIAHSEGTLTVQCSHNGYKRLPGKVIHQREWVFTDEYAKVSDRIEGQYEYAFAYYHIHPDVEVTVNGKQACLQLKCGKQVLVEATENISIENSTWHPEFGLSIPNKKLVIPVCMSLLEVTIRF